MFPSRTLLSAVSVNLAKNLKPKPKGPLGFGKIFSDHMLLMDYDPKKGWNSMRIEPYGSLNLDPSTLVLHYGQGVFEGLKAYRTPNKTIQLFRPEANLKRMNNSSRLIQIPEMDTKQVLEGIKELVRIEKDWVPSTPGSTLYIRPTTIAMDNVLGVKASNSYLFYVILCPVDAYYAEGFNPVKIFVTKEYVRAVRGGLGEAKTMANYAASLTASELAHKKGFSQVLWLDGVEQKYIEEVGSMNIFFVINGVVTTPKLNGSILPGITRDSVLTLARHLGMKTEERRISIDEVVQAHKNGTLTEVFGTGTAAVISPVKELMYNGVDMTIGNGSIGPISQKFYTDLQAIQFGQAPDPLSWITKVCDA